MGSTPHEDKFAAYRKPRLTITVYDERTKRNVEVKLEEVVHIMAVYAMSVIETTITLDTGTTYRVAMSLQDVVMKFMEARQ